MVSMCSNLYRMFSKKRSVNNTDRGHVPTLTFMQSCRIWYGYFLRSMVSSRTLGLNRRKLCLQHESQCRGFSLIEVLITSAVIGIITAIVVVRQGAFNSTILLKNQAYEIAIAIREAQVYSISTRGDESSASNPFRKNYGVFFDLSSGSANEMILFIDNGASSHDGRYLKASENTNPDLPVETMSFDSRYEVTKFCVDSTCSDSTNAKRLSITFARPDFDARIEVAKDNGDFLNDGFNEAKITLASVDSSGFERTITVSGTGQISVE